MDFAVLGLLEVRDDDGARPVEGHAAGAHRPRGKRAQHPDARTGAPPGRSTIGERLMRTSKPSSHSPPTVAPRSFRVPFSAVPPDAPVHVVKAELFKALGHPVRVRVLELLADGETPVSRLLAETGLEASHLSLHLGVLRRGGLVVARREGNAVFYRLAQPSVADLLTAARTVLVASLAGARDALAGLEREEAGER